MTEQPCSASPHALRTPWAPWQTMNWTSLRKSSDRGLTSLFAIKQQYMAMKKLSWVVTWKFRWKVLKINSTLTRIKYVKNLFFRFFLFSELDQRNSLCKYITALTFAPTKFFFCEKVKYGFLGLPTSCTEEQPKLTFHFWQAARSGFALPAEKSNSTPHLP